MNLYLIQYDGQAYYVEAKDFAEAIALWTAHVKAVWGTDFDGTEQPESCAHVHDEPVIRTVPDMQAAREMLADMRGGPD